MQMDISKEKFLHEKQALRVFKFPTYIDHYFEKKKKT